ncbi:alpha/beta hydrolase [Stakelama saccharophila]|uniref:Alpha/beta hydrolase n=1 Tax=Stakelama saccharophila TaxID=3075605 RepID=A0ABZ0BBE0_9SPHN|nr:alpha/beta hydrolase [Stakelama sp. W311]WNO53634.1 alpha/beta hydrolase [Stakelama sp. W311]
MLMRRTVLGAIAAAAALATAPYVQAQANSDDGATVIKLWPGEAPGKGKPSGPEHIGREGAALGAVSNVSVPRMKVYRPTNPDGTAVIIMGGGGYFRIQISHEAMPAARWLKAIGVTPIVLYYRLPDDGWSADAPIQDAQRAVRLVRSRAEELGIDPDEIGVMGFSAGGHLAAMTETTYDKEWYQPVDDADTLSSRPDFSALLFPVITLTAPYDTSRTKEELVGDSTDPATLKPYSPELHVTKNTPPTFLAQAEDDPIADPHHSMIMFDALQKAGVPAEMHLFQSGGHGFGLGAPGTLPSAWPRLFTAWAKHNGLMGAPAPKGRDDNAGPIEEDE